MYLGDKVDTIQIFTYGSDKILIKKKYKNIRPLTIGDVYTIIKYIPETKSIFYKIFDALGEKYPLFINIKNLIDEFQDNSSYYFPMQISAAFKYNNWHEYFINTFKAAKSLDYDYNTMHPKIAYTIIKLSKYIELDDVDLLKTALEKDTTLLNTYGYHHRFNIRYTGEMFVEFYRTKLKGKHVSKSKITEDNIVDTLHYCAGKSILESYVTNCIKEKRKITLRYNTYKDFYGDSINETINSIEPASPQEEEMIKDILADYSEHFVRAWRISNNTTNKNFKAFCKKNKINDENINLLFHGSEARNWLSIIGNGLNIEKARNGTFGNGLYFAPYIGKSMHYTDGAMYSNTDRTETCFVGLFEVATGNPFYVYRERGSVPRNWTDFHKNHPGKHCCWCENGKKKKGDKTLRRLAWDEVVVYREQQATMKYLIELIH